MMFMIGILQDYWMEESESRYEFQLVDLCYTLFALRASQFPILRLVIGDYFEQAKNAFNNTRLLKMVKYLCCQYMVFVLVYCLAMYLLLSTM